MSTKYLEDQLSTKNVCNLCWMWTSMWNYPSGTSNQNVE